MYDLWSVLLPGEKIKIDVLMPNGTLINLDVSREATLFEIKQDAFDEAQNHPLFGVLHDQQAYIFTCVNLTTSEQEEIIDEHRRLCDVRPFLAILRLVERKGDKAEKQLNARIGLLIGKGLHEFDVLKNPEVNDFRSRMRAFCEDEANERSKRPLLEKIKYQYPPRIVSSGALGKIPKYLESKMTDHFFTIQLRLENTGNFQPFKVDSRSTVQDFLKLAVQVLSPTNCDKVIDFTLKVCGQEDYLIGNHSFINYKYIRDCINNHKSVRLTMIPLTQIPVENSYSYLPTDGLGLRTYSGYSSKIRKKQISSFNIKENLRIHINSAERINCTETARVAVQVGVFHGGEAMCQLQSTVEGVFSNGFCSWEEPLTFDINICDIPRMARLCFVIFEIAGKASRKSSRAKLTYRTIWGQDAQVRPIVWGNTTVYDYKNVLRCGTATLSMWTYSHEDNSNQIINALGTVVPNPNIDEATCLTFSFHSYFDKDTPIAYPSAKMIREMSEQTYENVDGLMKKSGNASKVYLDQLKQICDRDPLTEMHEQDKELLWFLKEDCCLKMPNSLPHLLSSMKWNNHQDVCSMMVILETWPNLEPQKALVLLDYAFADNNVRRFAVKCLDDFPDGDLMMYLLQLVQAIKYESYLYSDLVEFLLKRALNNQRIGHYLFWLLRSEMSNPAVSVFHGLILEAYCRGAIEHMDILMKQMEGLNKFRQLTEILRQESDKRKNNRDKQIAFMRDLLDQIYYKSALAYVIHPLDPRYKLGKVLPEKCKFMDSKMKPLWLLFENEDKAGDEIFMIFKNGDDLRQDMLTLQMIRVIDCLWKDEGLDFRMTPYGCISTDQAVGLIEVVLNANTIANIQKEKALAVTSAFNKECLFSWLKDHNPTEESLNKAIEEFSMSCAGYSVATYVLGIADRHSDNIMVKSDGKLFHIDFGHILGKFKEKFGIKRERVPFVLTKDFEYVIKKGKLDDKQCFNEFQKNCEKAFKILRKNGSFIISLFAMMLSTGIPELSSTKDLEYLRETLVLDLSEAEALNHFKCAFEEAKKHSWTTSLNWWFHNFAKNNT